MVLRRNALPIFMSIELQLNAVNLTLVAFSRMHHELDGQILAFFSMVVAAAEVVVGLAIIVAVFRRTSDHRRRPSGACCADERLDRPRDRDPARSRRR